MRRCADQIDCGYENRESELFCRACALPLLNTALAGRYVIHALISKGGYAAVFYGIDRNLARRIAIKVLLPSKTTPSEHENFLREARIAATLDHPNIAPVLDYGKDGPSVFLVMPLYSAGSLRNRLAAANGPLPASETTKNFHQLTSALQYAHTRPRPVIHRDMKPENILLHQEDARLVITDFGIARSLEPGTSVGKTITVRGTVGYMAPEQTSGVVDPRGDQFGCAVILYEMLTGYHPLDAGNAIPAPSTLNNTLPQAMDRVVLRALASRPEDRYPDMLEFTQAFDIACRPVAKMRITPPATKIGAGSTAVKRNVNAPNPPNSLTPPPFASVSNKAGDTPDRVQPVRKVPPSTSSAQEKCLEGDELLKQQLYSQALQAYNEALRMDPLNLYAWNGKGMTLYNQGNYKKALEAYQRATEIEPENPDVWFSAGLVLNNLQRYPQALVHFERALEIDPHYVAALNGKAFAQSNMNMPEEALTSYEQALTYDSKSFQAWNGLGNARTALRDFTGAVEAYTHALLINPHSAVAWCNKAEVLKRLGHNRAALDALNEATETDRSYARAWTLKAAVYDALGNSQEADKARKRAKPWGLVN